PARGVFGVTQAVFSQGELLAAHSYQALALGVGGSACCRESVARPVVEEHLRQLGSALRWHGALHIEYFYEQAQPAYIHANPRIGETANATLSGTNLCDALVHVSRNYAATPSPASRLGVRTHSLLTTLLASAEKGRRGGLLRDLWQVCARRGLFHGSQD